MSQILKTSTILLQVRAQQLNVNRFLVRKFIRKEYVHPIFGIATYWFPLNNQSVMDMTQELLDCKELQKKVWQ